MKQSVSALDGTDSSFEKSDEYVSECQAGLVTVRNLPCGRNGHRPAQGGGGESTESGADWGAAKLSVNEEGVCGT